MRPTKRFLVPVAAALGLMFCGPSCGPGPVVLAPELRFVRPPTAGDVPDLEGLGPPFAVEGPVIDVTVAPGVRRVCVLHYGIPSLGERRPILVSVWSDTGARLWSLRVGEDGLGLFGWSLDPVGPDGDLVAWTAGELKRISADGSLAWAQRLVPVVDSERSATLMRSSPSGDRVATAFHVGGNDGGELLVEVRSADDGALLRRVSLGAGAPLDCLAFSGDGSFLALSRSGAGDDVIEVATGEIARLSEVAPSGCDPDSDFWLSGTGPGFVVSWVRSDEPSVEVRRVHRTARGWQSSSESGCRGLPLAMSVSGGEAEFAYEADGGIRIERPGRSAFRPRSVRPPVVFGHMDGASGLLVTVTTPYGIQVFDRDLRRLPRSGGWAACVTAGACSRDGRVALLDSDEGLLVGRTERGVASKIDVEAEFPLALSPDGSRVAATVRPRTVRVLDVSRLAVEAEIAPADGDEVQCIAFAEGGTKLAICAGTPPTKLRKGEMGSYVVELRSLGPDLRLEWITRLPEVIPEKLYWSERDACVIVASRSDAVIVDGATGNVRGRRDFDAECGGSPGPDLAVEPVSGVCAAIVEDSLFRCSSIAGGAPMVRVALPQGLLPTAVAVVDGCGVAVVTGVDARADQGDPGPHEASVLFVPLDGAAAPRVVRTIPWADPFGPVVVAWRRPDLGVEALVSGRRVPTWLLDLGDPDAGGGR